MSYSDVLSNGQQLPERIEVRSAAVEQGIPPEVTSHRRGRSIEDRLVYGLAIFTFIVAPFVLMFVVAPIAVAFILLTDPDHDAGASSEASVIHQPQHAPWSTTGLRRTH